MDNANEDRGYKLKTIAKTVIFPMGIYSKKVKTLADLPEGARIGMPNDPTNSGRALLLLQEQGLIKVSPEPGLRATPLDVIENPRKIRFALDAGLEPAKDALTLESSDSRYANILVVREKDQARSEFVKLV